MNVRLQRRLELGRSRWEQPARWRKLEACDAGLRAGYHADRAAMKRIVFLAAAFLVACGSGSHTATSGSPVVTGDPCALHEDATSCRADSGGCAWYPNTRPCVVGQPCPAGWCYSPQDGGSGFDGGVAAACACPGASPDVCMMQIGGPAIQAQPAITCEAIAVGCSLSDSCFALFQTTGNRSVSVNSLLSGVVDPGLQGPSLGKKPRKRCNDGAKNSETRDLRTSSHNGVDGCHICFFSLQRS